MLCLERYEEGRRGVGQAEYGASMSARWVSILAPVETRSRTSQPLPSPPSRPACRAPHRVAPDERPSTSSLRDQYRAARRRRLFQSDVSLYHAHPPRSQLGCRRLRLPVCHAHRELPASADEGDDPVFDPLRVEPQRLDPLAGRDLDARAPTPVGVVPAPSDPEREPDPYGFHGAGRRPGRYNRTWDSMAHQSPR